MTVSVCIYMALQEFYFFTSVALVVALYLKLTNYDEAKAGRYGFTILYVRHDIQTSLYFHLKLVYQHAI